MIFCYIEFREIYLQKVKKNIRCIKSGEENTLKISTASFLSISLEMNIKYCSYLLFDIEYSYQE